MQEKWNARIPEKIAIFGGWGRGEEFDERKLVLPDEALGNLVAILLVVT